MVTFKLSGKKYQFPTRWEDVTYSLYVDLLATKDLADVLSVLTGIKTEVIRAAEIKNLAAINTALAFMNKPPDFTKRPAMLNDIKMPKLITAESLAQFQDVEHTRARLPAKTTEEYTIEDHKLTASLYLRAAAIYYCKQKFGKYDSGMLDGIEEELQKASCMEVISLGSFFLFRPINSPKSIIQTFRNIFLPKKKKRPALPN